MISIAAASKTSEKRKPEFSSKESRLNVTSSMSTDLDLPHSSFNDYSCVLA
jgi:hypothetical protein